MKKLIIIIILLAILTIGAVSASDNATSDGTDISLNKSDARQDNLQKTITSKSTSISRRFQLQIRL